MQDFDIVVTKVEYSPEVRQEYIKEFKKSGLNASKFALKHKIPKTTFYDWLCSDFNYASLHCEYDSAKQNLEVYEKFKSANYSIKQIMHIFRMKRHRFQRSLSAWKKIVSEEEIKLETKKVEEVIVKKVEKVFVKIDDDEYSERKDEIMKNIVELRLQGLSIFEISFTLEIPYYVCKNYFDQVGKVMQEKRRLDGNTY